MFLIYIGPREPQKCLRTSPVIVSAHCILIILFSTARTNSNLFSTGVKANLSMNAASRVFLNCFLVAKECRMRSDNRNFSSYNPSHTLNLGTEEECGDGIKITSFIQVLSTCLGC